VVLVAGQHAGDSVPNLVVQRPKRGIAGVILRAT
jgi:hypothetical protein